MLLIKVVLGRWSCKLDVIHWRSKEVSLTLDAIVT